MALDDDILQALRLHPDGLGRADLQRIVGKRREEPWRFRLILKRLETAGKLHRVGVTRAAHYHLGPRPTQGPRAVPDPVREIGDQSRPAPPMFAPPAPGLFATDSSRLVAMVTRPLAERAPCTYDRALLDRYRANETFYLGERDRRHLLELGTTPALNQPAGTWARNLFERLLIDLSWNSSRLEGNTYSLLDTERLFRERRDVVGHQVLETQMLLNHKQAIEYIVEEAPRLRLIPHTLRTLHGLLAENLLADSADEGQLRRAPVAIHDSAYIPLAVPQQLEELFVRALTIAEAISDPFEQSFFLLVHLPYLQPFADGNKRTSRLAANIPLLRTNLQPLSFVDVPREAYTLATLVVYEQARVEALRDVYLWAYARSAARYRAIMASLGEPDPFRLRHRDALREVVRTIVQDPPPPAELDRRLAELAAAHASATDRPAFEAHARQELRTLNEGTFHRYGLRPSEFERWLAARPR